MSVKDFFKPNHYYKLLGAIADLVRLGMAPLTISVILLGYYCGNAAEDFREALILGIVGLCAHIFGFTFNDIVDYQVDQYSPVRQNSPLVNGSIPRRAAILIAVIPIPVSIFLYAKYASSSYGIPILIASILLSLIYNLGSKRGPIPRFLAEISLAGSIALLSISGALFPSPHLSAISYAVSLSIGVILLDINSIASGLKDLPSDIAAGGTSFITKIGARIDQSGVISLPKIVSWYAVVIKILTIATLLWTGYLLKPGIIIIIITIFLTLYSLLHLRLMFTTMTIMNLHKALPLLGGYFMFGALLTLISSQFPLLVQVLIILLDIYLFSYPIKIALNVARKKYFFIQSDTAQRSKPSPHNFPHQQDDSQHTSRP